MKSQIAGWATEDGLRNLSRRAKILSGRLGGARRRGSAFSDDVRDDLTLGHVVRPAVLGAPLARGLPAVCGETFQRVALCQQVRLLRDLTLDHRPGIRALQKVSTVAWTKDEEAERRALIEHFDANGLFAARIQPGRSGLRTRRPGHDQECRSPAREALRVGDAMNGLQSAGRSELSSRGAHGLQIDVVAADSDEEDPLGMANLRPVLH